MVKQTRETLITKFAARVDLVYNQTVPNLRFRTTADGPVVCSFVASTESAYHGARPAVTDRINNGWGNATT